MPAVSKKQQRFFGYLLSNPEERKKKGISKKAAKDFASDVQEVAPPGWGHTKAEKEKTKPWKPKSKIGGTAAAFKKALDDGRFKGLPGSKTKKEKTADMFKLMWSMKKKGDKPHYKPGTDKKYKKYQEEDWKPEIEVVDTKKRKKAAEKKRKEAESTLPPHLRLDVMKKAFAHTNESVTKDYEKLKKKIGSKEKHDKPAIQESSYRNFMAASQAAKDRLQKKVEDRKKKDAQYVDTREKGVRFYDKKGKGRIRSGKKIYD